MATAEATPPLHRSPLQRSRSAFPASIDRTKLPPVGPVRRLSLSRIKSLDEQHSNVSVRSTQRRRHDNEERKVEQYERMMGRFQLRRVPHSHSINSQTASTTHRETLPSAHERHSIAAPNAEVEGAHRAAPRDPKSLQNRVTTFIGKLAPFAPTGPATFARLAVLALVVLIQFVLLPLRLTYAPLSVSVIYWETLFGLVAGVVFCFNVVMVANTATYTPCGQLVTTRRAILRQYRRHGLALDVLACIPFEAIATHATWWHNLCRLTQLVVRVAVFYRHRIQFQRLWTKATTNHDLQWLDWLLYSRFGHLVRIGRLLLRVCLLTHYMACVWTLLNRVHHHGGDVEAMHDDSSGLLIHLHSMYDVLQLLQGQGLETQTVAQDLFGMLAVLLGSIALAVMFGHVAILIGNFSANQTAYQRKIESVFAIMEKLQLPQAIRDRVHQYYGYLHSEYESLDGEVVKFAKELSHTLELEVVLFKYMDVFVNVPHWSECSPDFQKQLLLSVTVRVYLPDDFIIRCGEVGTSCFIVNRGICKQYQFGGGNDELPTPPVRPDLGHSAGSVDVKRSSDAKYYVRDGVSSLDTARSAPEADSSRPCTLMRGDVIGERALICNYVRTTDVRAFTYVEMCVLEREPFQRMLTRYPDDRGMVLTSMVGQCLRQRKAQDIECPLMDMVRRIAPTATIDDGVAMLVEAMSPKISDPTIVFGVTEHLEEKLFMQSAGQPAAEQDFRSLAQLPAQVQQLQAQLDRIERALQTNGDRFPLSGAGNTQAIQSPPVGTALGQSGPRRSQPTRRDSDRALRSRRSLSTHTPYADWLFQSHTNGSTRW